VRAAARRLRGRAALAHGVHVLARPTRAAGASSLLEQHFGAAHAAPRAAACAYHNTTLRWERGPSRPAARSSASAESQLQRRSRQLTNALVDCASGEEVLSLVAASLSGNGDAVRLNEIHVSTAMLRLTKCEQPRRGCGYDERFTRLLSAAEELFDSMGPQSFANVLYACGKLGVLPSDRWLARYWEASQAALPQFTPQGLSNTLYACGELELLPPPVWLRCFWQVSQAALPQFNSQECSNTFYACGQLALVPPSDWLLRYWRASEAALTHFNPQNFSNTLYACGQLKLTPPSDWLRCFWQTSQAALPKYNQQDFANTLYACGQLALLPPPGWTRNYWAACKASLEHFNGQDCSNILLSVAILSLWDCHVLHELWQKLNLAVQSAETGERSLLACQLFQLHLVAAAERPGLLPAPSPEVLEYVRREWREQQQASLRTGSSALHEAVSACLTAQDVEHVKERWCERSELTIDIAIERATHRIALEVDGPYHFLLNGQPDGSTRLRNRCLAAHGWLVVVVDYRVWDTLRTAKERDAYLLKLLNSATAATDA
jgi:hypothetical protein